MEAGNWAVFEWCVCTPALREVAISRLLGVWEGSAMDGCRKDDGTLLDLLAAEQAALSKCLDVERKAHDLT